ncbi:MAG: hypothetical protein KA473_12685, partial [Anaerolineales bacterium]|nr:hypothetical protein [Anaerolineales bacterium]
MKIKTLLLDLFMCLVVLSACTPAATAEPAASPSVSATSIPSTATSIVTEEPTVPESYPLSTRTNIADVDAVLAAVESGD